MTQLPFEALIDQLRIIRILLMRTLVQQQLLAFLLVVVGTWLLAQSVQALIQRRTSRTLAASGLMRGANYLYWPLLALGLGWISAEFVLSNSRLFDNLLNLLWLLLLYRLLVALLYFKLSVEQARRYHHWLLTPLIAFAFLVLPIRLTVGSSATLQRIALLSIGDFVITLGTLTATALIIYATVILSWISQDVLYRYIAPQLNREENAVHAVGTITRYVVITVGILLALRALGLNLTSFAIIGGGLSVGIGFGLQQIVANFFAGIFLLFEQALRPGDVINLEGEVGVVEKLNIRSTVIRTYDNVEVIVPNETFLTSKLTSYTKSDRTVRLALPVGAGYDSDPEQVSQILLDAGQSHPDVLETPQPAVFFRGFGDSSINFDLMVWVQDPRQMPRVRSDLYFTIWKQFAANKIEIPFPQHDLNLRRGWEKMQPQ